MELNMSWDGASLVSLKRNKIGPLGLKNLGNSCYLNSVLQCLTYTPPLANFCLRKLHSSLCDSLEASERKRDCPFCILEKRISRSLSMDLVLDAPWKIMNSLRIFSDQFQGGRQEDAHEFLRYVIDACHNTCLRLKKLCSNGTAAGASVVREIFGGSLQSQVKCLSCGSESNKVDEIMDVSLDVLHSNSLKDALQRFFQAEVLDGNNKYRCESCKKLVAAKKQMSILQAPNILVVQLKRFEGAFGGKIDKLIAFEEVLVLSSFMCKTSKDPRPEYRLFGTIVHSGFSPESGHYYAYIKDAMGRWYCCNDSFISVSSVQEVLSEKVYILFFCRTNQRPGSVTISPACTFTNGVKSRDSNGRHEASKTLKPDRPLKATNAKPVEQSARMEMITTSKIDRVTDKLPNSTPIKFSIGASNSKGPSIPNGKISNKQTNGDAKQARLEILEKSKPTMNGNGLNNHDKVNSVDGQRSQTSVSTNEKVNSVDGQRSQTSVSANGFGNSQPERINSNEVGGTTNGELTKEKKPDHQEKVNGADSHSTISGSKRKQMENACTLLAEDVQSREKVANLKEALAKEATSVLRSCGWYDKVYSFMSSGKRLRTQEAGSTPLTSDEQRKLLIMDTKPIFLPQIPESLKGDLIKTLQSFSREK